MDEMTRHHYDLRFKVDFLEKKGSAFQDFFSYLMGKAHPGDFISSKPWGKDGDRKNDGYLASKRTLFQVYAPETLRASQTVAKIEEDFKGALPHWKTHFDRWVFVHNAQGVGPHVLEKILDLRTQYPQITFEVWGFEELRREFWTLSEHEIAAWFGGGFRDQTPGLRFVFDADNEYPELRFSLVNHTASQIQVSKLQAVRSAALKDERSPVRHLMGPRMHFQINLSTTRIGEPVELFGRNTVSTLVPGDADAIALNVQCQNTINLIDFEAEIVSDQESSTRRCYPHHMHVVRTGVTGFSGEVGKGQIRALSRDQAARILYDKEEGKTVADDLEAPIELLQMLLFRGAAFISRGNLWGYFVELKNRYEATDDWGSILASFSEYHAMWEVVPGLQAYLEEWLSDPNAVGSVSPWDYESRPLTILTATLRRLKTDQAISLCLKILNASAGFMECREPDADEDSEMESLIRSMSVQSVRAAALRYLFENDRKAATQLGVILSVLSDFDANGVRDLFENSEASAWEVPGVSTDRKAREEWKQSEPIERLCREKSPWASELPRIMAAVDARCDHDNLARFLTHSEIYVRSQLAQNPNLTESLIQQLARDDATVVKRDLARRASLSHEVRKTLLATNDKIIRNWLDPQQTQR